MIEFIQITEIQIEKSNLFQLYILSEYKGQFWTSNANKSKFLLVTITCTDYLCFFLKSVTGTKLCSFHKYQNHDITHETCFYVIDSLDRFYTMKYQSIKNLRCDDKLPTTFLWKLPNNLFLVNYRWYHLARKHRHNSIVELSPVFSFSIDQRPDGESIIWSSTFSDLKTWFRRHDLQTKIIWTG